MIKDDEYDYTSEESSNYSIEGSAGDLRENLKYYFVRSAIAHTKSTLSILIFLHYNLKKLQMHKYMI